MSTPRHDPRFGAAYLRYRGTVRGALAQLGVPEAERDDLAQEVFVVLLRQLARLADDEGEAGGLRAWLYQTARRVAANHRRGQRRRSRREEALGQLAASEPDQRVAIADAAVFLADFFDTLDDDARATFVLAEVEGRSGPEIAAQQGINVNTAYARVRSVRARLHEALADERNAGWIALLPSAVPTRAPLLLGVFGLIGIALAWASSRKLVIAAVALLLLAIPVVWLARGSETPRGDGPPAPAPSPELAQRRGADDETTTVEPAPTRSLARIEGRVTTLAGDVVAGTRVCIERRRRTDDRVAPRCVDADGEGRYAIDGLLADVYRLASSAPGHVEVTDPAAYSGLRVGPAQRRRGVDLTLRPGGAQVRGTVIDATGGAIEGALVRPPHVTAVFTRSDAQGRFTLWLDGSDVPELTAVADGYAGGNASLVWPGENDVEIALTPEATIEGVVIDEAGDTVAGVAVMSRAAIGFFEGTAELPAVVTDASGRFVLRALSPGRHHPLVREREWEGLAQRPVVLAIGESVQGVVITVRVARRVQGRATMPDGTPCTGALVIARDAVGEELDRTHTDGEGVLELGGLPAEPIRLSIECEHALPIDIDLELSRSSVVGETWAAEPREGVLVRGRVLGAEDQPLADAFVELTPVADGPEAGGSARTDREGRFEIGPLPPGAHRAWVNAHGHGDSSEPGRIEIGEHPVEIDLRVQPNLQLRVRTIDPSGTAVAGVDVMFRQDPRGAGGYVTSGHDGVAIIERPAGAYRVRAARPGEAGKPIGANAFDDAVAVRLAADAEITLQVPARDGIVRGRVVDEDGGPVADARVEVTTAEPMKDWFGKPKHQRVAEGWADDDGVFAIAGLEAGSYAVRAATPGGVAGASVVAHTGSDAVVVLPRTGSLCGTIAIDGDDPPRAFEIAVHSADDRRVRQQFRASGGAWCVEDIARGVATIEASTIAGTATASAEVPDGGTHADIALRVVARGRVRARIVDGGEQPVSGAYVWIRSKGGGLHSSGDRSRTESGTDGVIDLPGPAGAVELTVLAPAGYETRVVAATLVSGERVELGDIVLETRD